MAIYLNKHKDNINGRSVEIKTEETTEEKPVEQETNTAHTK